MRVTEDHFGSVYSGFPQESHHSQVLEELGTYITRWPGGHLAENRTDVYDITTELVLDPTTLYAPNPERSRLSRNEVLDISIQSGREVSVVVPTYRYIDDLERGEQELQTFLDNLVANASLTGETIRLEIGSEYYASDNFSADAYGDMAQRFAALIDSNQGRGIDFETVIQMGKSANDNDAILSYFSGDNITLVDNVSVHVLPINLNNLYNATIDGQQVDRFDLVQANLQSWQDMASQANHDLPDVLMTAWAVGTATDDPNEVDLSFQDYGARGGVTTLALFAEAILSGVQEASIWGVGEAGLNSLGRVTENGVELTHSGAVFQELNNSVIGLSLSPSEAGSFDWDTGPEVGNIAFTGLGKMVFYAAYGTDSISSVTNLANRSESFSSETAEIVEARRIQTEYQAGYEVQNNEFDRLYEMPSIEIQDLDQFGIALNGNWLSFQQTEDFEVIEVTISWRHDGSTGSDVLEGYATADWFDGQAGNDTLLGFEDNDTLLGAAGHDVIVGGIGHDSLEGGDGGDVIIGDSYYEPTTYQLDILGSDFFDIL